jgi:protein-arginine kinase activator protein McsA
MASLEGCFTKHSKLSSKQRDFLTFTAMKFVSFLVLAVILVAGQSCMSIVSKHSRATVKIETNTPVKVYVFSQGKKKFVPADQVDNRVEGSKSFTKIDFKKVVVMRPTQTKPKKLDKLRIGGELVICKKKYTPEMYRSGVTEVSGFDTIIRTDVKQELILKFVPEDPNYKEVIYQVNAQKNKKRRNIALALDIPFLVFAIPFIMGDLNANQVQYDLPQKVVFALPANDKINSTSGETDNTVTTGNDTKNTPSNFTIYATKTADKLEAMKKEAVAKGEYELAAEIKKEQDLRVSESDKINALQKQLDEKLKTEDYNGAALIKKELQPLKDNSDRKDALRKALEAAVTAEDYTKAEKIKQELKAFY